MRQREEQTNPTREEVEEESRRVVARRGSEDGEVETEGRAALHSPYAQIESTERRTTTKQK